MRILSLAKQLETKTSILMKLCSKMGLDDIKSHRTPLTDSEVMLLRQMYRTEYMPASVKPNVTQNKPVQGKTTEKPKTAQQVKTGKQSHQSDSKQDSATSRADRNRHGAREKSFEPKHNSSDRHGDSRKSPDKQRDGNQRGERFSENRKYRDDNRSRDDRRNRDGRPIRDDKTKGQHTSQREDRRRQFDANRKEGLPRREKVIFISANLKNPEPGAKPANIEHRTPRFKKHFVENNKVVHPAKDSSKPQQEEIAEVPMIPSDSGFNKDDRVKGYRDRRMTDKEKKIKADEDVKRKKKTKLEQAKRKRVNKIFSPDDDDYDTSRKYLRKGKKKVKFSTGNEQTPVVIKPREIVVQRSATVKEISASFGIQMDKIISYFFKNAIMKRANDYLTEDEIVELATEFDIDFSFHDITDKISDVEVDLIKNEKEDDPEGKLKPRPPVVTMLGHVDHGKTSLLDYIRHSGVAKAEDGGITQHIGASVVNTPNGDIVFIDTPGHEAFTAMRSRGAQVTDIAILVVAADDGVMPTTIEAYDHIKASKVEVIVALNKVDKPDSNPMKVKGQLAKMGLTPSGDWGGTTEVIECSAITGEGVDDLLETILLTAEVGNLQGNPDRKASGFVLESNKSETEGVSATVLVKKGTLKIHDNIIAGFSCGRIRAMFDSRGNKVENVGPAYPVRIFGLNDPAMPGDLFYTVDNIAIAQKLADRRRDNSKMLEISAARPKITTENILNMIQAGSITEVNIIIRADTVGSIEVLKAQIAKLKNSEVKANIIRAAVGAITENDILLAASSNALVLGFHIIEEMEAKRLAKAEHVEIRLFRVIYELIDFIKSALEGKLAPAKIEHKLGRAEVRKVFSSSKLGNIAGCYITEGIVKRNARLRLYRSGKEISPEDGYILGSLRRNSDDVKEVKEGFECGMVIENFNDIRPRDVLEFFELEERKRTLDEVDG